MERREIDKIVDIWRSNKYVKSGLINIPKICMLTDRLINFSLNGLAHKVFASILYTVKNRKKNNDVKKYILLNLSDIIPEKNAILKTVRVL